MQRIVLWQIAMVIVTIGTYAFVLASSGNEHPAAAYAAVVTVAIAVAYAIAAAVFTVTVAYAIAAAIGFATAVAIGARPDLAAFMIALAVFAVTIAASAAAKEFNVPKRWAFTAYGAESGTIFGAIATGSVGWALVIGALGILALLVMWKLGPRVTLGTQPAGSVSAVHTNGG